MKTVLAKTEFQGASIKIVLSSMQAIVYPERIKALFIDIGGVLLTNGWPGKGRREAARLFGYDFEEAEQRHDLVFPIYEQGHISFEGYLDLVFFYKDRTFTKEEFREFMFGQSELLPDTLNWLVVWKESHLHLQFFSLNNEPKDLHQFRVEKFGLRRLFDGFIVSCDLGLRKPDPHLYALAVAFAGVEPEECLYIDDREVLVAAGRKAGLQAIVHRDPEETKNLLAAI